MGPSWPFTQPKQVPASISQRPIRQLSGHCVEQVNPNRLGVEHPINYTLNFKWSINMNVV